MKRFVKRPIYIRLDTSKATNRDDGVNVTVFLYNTCAASGVKEAVRQAIRIPFNLNTTEIIIDYVSYDRNVTLTELQDTETSPTIDVRDLFTITNKGSVMWKSLPALIILEMDAYVVKNTVITTMGAECKEVSSKSLVMLKCFVNLEPKSTFKITIIRSLLKEKIMEIFDSEKISINSTYTLFLEPTLQTLNKTFTTMLYFQVDTSFGSNKYYMIALAVTVALFVLVVIIIILYKVGFFERKEKTKLDALKEEIKQKSIRRPNRDDVADTLQENNQGNIEVVDDIPLQLMDFQDTRDSSSLIQN
ncbi:uncharacterized protein LOC123653722 [Melitaea cinxia]|uniref:uncharacterized protein LOC123653722 n=1 Tax=Melitaea cinxia TaxID=113334 RepID=UPI001E271A7B|nr:uncharacterized protein LOC123653722 [Melitaea cinxia]